MKSPPPLPPLASGGYLYNAFREAGMVSMGFGQMPLTWAEIDAYARLTGEITTPFEARMLRAMSQAYLSGLRAGEDEFSIPPWEGD